MSTLLFPPSCLRPLVCPAVPRDGAPAGGDETHHPGGEPGSAVPGHPDGRQAGQGALRAHRGGVRQCREVRGELEDAHTLTHTHTANLL